MRQPKFLSLICLLATLLAVPDSVRAQQRDPWRTVFVPPGAVTDSHIAGNQSFHELFAPQPVRARAPEILASAAQSQTATPPPEPTHTGFKALMRDTASDFAWFPRRRSTYVLLGVGAATAALAHPLDDDVNVRLKGRGWSKDVFVLGKYLGYAYVQAGAAFTTYLVGRYVVKPDGQKTNKISHIGFDLLRANILTQALTYGVKYSVRRDRPTGKCCGFPSGHASVTFAAASVLERHFGYRAAWPTFAIAGYVAASRLRDNVHFLSDVVFGSALGIASGWTVVGRHGRDDYALMPVPVRGGLALQFSWTPGMAHQTGAD